MQQSSFPLEASAEAQAHPHWALVERLLRSQCFQGSKRLRDFLLYVSDCALRGMPDEATEQQIGIHVFERTPGYNSSEDSIVRAQARLLRQKLAEYFAHEGLSEEIILTIPKGRYLPVFESRNPSDLPPPKQPPQEDSASIAQTEQNEVEIKANKPAAPRERRLWLVSLVVLALLLAFGIGRLSSPRPHPEQDVARGPLYEFWQSFLAPNSSMVIYSNALFTGNSKEGLKYADPSTIETPLPPNYVDDYTGIGELTGVYDLARLFDRYHSTFVLKRSLLVTWDQAQVSNMIFLGSVAENPSLRQIPNTREFTLYAAHGVSGILNHHPLPGEQKLYERPDYPLTHDYAILALLPGLSPRHKTLILSGLTTYGTQAAVAFVSNPGDVEELLKRIRTKTGEIRPFEAVIEASIIGGVPVEPHLVTLHIR